MNQLEKNLAFFVKYFPELKSSFVAVKSSDEVQIRYTDTGLPVLVKDNKLLSPPGNPILTAAAFLEKSSLETAELIIFGGIGIGYYLLEADGRAPDSCIFLLMERDINVFRRSLEFIDYEKIIRKRKVFLLIGDKTAELGQVLVDILARNEIRGLQVLLHPQIFPEYFQDFDINGMIETARKMTVQNRATRMNLGLAWYRNLLRNIQVLPEVRGVKDLFDRYKNVPAIIVCAGPSLDRNIHYLKELGERCLLIATDAAFPALCLNGFEPDFVVCIDPQKTVKKHFRHTIPEKTALVCPPCVPPEVVNKFTNRVFFSDHLETNCWEKIKNIIKRCGYLNTGGSVSIYAFNLAWKMGAHPVVFIGQDLAYPGFKSYCRGSTYYDGWEDKINRFVNYETMDYHNINSRNRIETYDAAGRKVYTTPTMLNYLKWFELKLNSPSSRYLNATEGGIWTKNINRISLKEFSSTLNLKRKKRIKLPGKIRINLNLAKMVRSLRFRLRAMLNFIRDWEQKFVAYLEKHDHPDFPFEVRSRIIKLQEYVLVHEPLLAPFDLPMKIFRERSESEKKPALPDSEVCGEIKDILDYCRIIKMTVRFLLDSLAENPN